MSNISFYFVQDNGVHFFRELTGDLGDFVSDTGRDTPDHIVYLVRPLIPQIKTITLQIKGCISTGYYDLRYILVH